MTETSREDEIIAKLRVSLCEWYKKAADEGIEHDLTLAALCLFTASGVASAGYAKEDFLKLMGLYFDMYGPKKEHD